MKKFGFLVVLILMFIPRSALAYEEIEHDPGINNEWNEYYHEYQSAVNHYNSLVEQNEFMINGGFSKKQIDSQSQLVEEQMVEVNELSAAYYAEEGVEVEEVVLTASAEVPTETTAETTTEDSVGRVPYSEMSDQEKQEVKNNLDSIVVFGIIALGIITGFKKYIGGRKASKFEKSVKDFHLKYDKLVDEKVAYEVIQIMKDYGKEFKGTRDNNGGRAVWIGLASLYNATKRNHAVSFECKQEFYHMCKVVGVFNVFPPDVEDDGIKRAGEDGEKRVQFKLKYVEHECRKIWHGKHYRYKNLTNEIDHLILGPKGVILIETKNYGGELHFTDGHIKRTKLNNGNVVEEILDDPSNQMMMHVTLIKNLLRDGGFEDIPVTQILCIANENATISGKPADAKVNLMKGSNLLLFISGLENIDEEKTSRLDAVQELIDNAIFERN